MDAIAAVDTSTDEGAAVKKQLQAKHRALAIRMADDILTPADPAPRVMVTSRGQPTKNPSAATRRRMALTASLPKGTAAWGQRDLYGHGADEAEDEEVGDSSFSQ